MTRRQWLRTKWLGGALTAALVVACVSAREAPSPLAEGDRAHTEEPKLEESAGRRDAVARPQSPPPRDRALEAAKAAEPPREPRPQKPAVEGVKIGQLAAASSLGNLFSVGHGSGVDGGGSKPPPRLGVAAHVRKARQMPAPDPTGDSEQYVNHGVNPFTPTSEDRRSTFSIDVDTASYTIARRKLLEGQLPPEASVRVEEFLNYFRYEYRAPGADRPLAIQLDGAPSPFTPGRHLVRVGLQGRRLTLGERKPAHLTFLVDVSGSMQSPDKLPLAQKALRILVDNLRDGDTVGLVTYAGGVREVLKPTGLERKAEIHAAIESLTAGGSTAMASGIELAYAQAATQLRPEAISRVIILSDGDANVGATGHAEILGLIRHRVKEGITCSVVGFGMGNYRDDLMEAFANKGNGNYAYVDSLLQARRVFQEQLGSTLEVIAQDVKLQVEFDPAQVKRYRLVGYENRNIADRDFRNDKVDAGEVGSGHSVTALYEVELAPGAGAGLATVSVRAKKPRGETAQEWSWEFPADALAPTFEAAAPDLRFATSVMAAAEILRRSPHAKEWRMEQVLAIAKGAAHNAERREFVELLSRAEAVVRTFAAR